MICNRCKRESAFTMVVDEVWQCSRCTYELEYPDSPLSQLPRPKAPKVQKETLFDADDTR